MTGIINVSPEKLISTSEEFSSQGTTISGLTAEMMNIVTSLSSTWEGQASASYIAKFKALESDIQILNRRIQEHVNDLIHMANAYSSTEDSNVESSSSLTSGIFS